LAAGISCPRGCRNHIEFVAVRVGDASIESVGGLQERFVCTGCIVRGAYDELIRKGEIPPMIIVTPEGDKAYWFNHFEGPAWGDYVANELVQFIDGNYRTIPKRESRAIGGLSMGALGAMQLTLNHPDLFTIVGLRSPTFRRIGDPDVPAFFGDAEYYKLYDPFYQVERTGAQLPSYTFVIIGQDDIWLGRINDFLHLMDLHKTPYELHIYPGAHDAEFFGSRLDEDLRFYGAHIATEP